MVSTARFLFSLNVAHTIVEVTASQLGCDSDGSATSIDCQSRRCGSRTAVECDVHSVADISSGRVTSATMTDLISCGTVC